MCSKHEVSVAVPLAERPREKMERAGIASLSDAELLALLLGTGHRQIGSATRVGESLLATFGDLRSLMCASTQELSALSGVGTARASRLLAAAELARRLEAQPLEMGVAVSSSAIVGAHFGPLLADEKREVFLSLLLDTKNRLLGKVRISEGSLGASLVHPREAFRPAVRAAAAAVVFLHNHPSGDPTPSPEDRRITQRLRDAGTLLGIPVLDHVIVGRRAHFSFADEGWR